MDQVLGSIPICCRVQTCATFLTHDAALFRVFRIFRGRHPFALVDRHAVDVATAKHAKSANEPTEMRGQIWRMAPGSMDLGHGPRKPLLHRRCKSINEP